jgi:carbon-monoxide dehydrogenase medium subunit
VYIPDFNFHRPASIQDACRILAESPDAAPLAGGTDLLVEIKQGGRSHHDIVSLTAIPQLRSIASDERALFIGAGATHNAIRGSQVVIDAFPAIAEAAATIGTDQIRNVGTIGGNLCTAASCSDMAPVLMALAAEVEITGIGSTRILPLEEFFVSHRSTRLQKGELMTNIIVRRSSGSSGGRLASWYEKFGMRGAAAISVASVAVALRLDGDMCTEARIVIGAVAPTPKLSTGASAALTGQPIEAMTEGSPLLAQAGKAAAADSLPIDDIRGSSDYRRTIIQVLTQRAVLRALERTR